MGMAYFDAFKSDGIDHEGWCSLGQQIDEVMPCEGSDADSFAEALGMKKRDANNPDDWGSTFVIIEPDFSSNDLKAAIEQYWFPLLADDSNPLKVTISDQDTPMTLSAKDNIDVEGYFLAETERLKLNQIEYKKIRSFIKQLGSVCVAYSGGVDSTLVTSLAYEQLGNKAIAITNFFF